MAGIGFKLEKILSKNSYLSLIEGYLYSAIVTSGPVLFTIFSVSILGVLSSANLNEHDIQIFRTTVVYIYGVSLVLSSPAQMVITRYMADRIFLKDYQALVPAYVGIVMISSVLHAVVGYIAALYIDLEFGTVIAAVALFVNMGIIWIAMIVLSAAKEFIWLVKAFMYGAMTSLAAGYILGFYKGLMGIMVGFTLGQILTVILLNIQIFREFDYRKRVEFYFLAYFKRFTSLAFIATFFNIGIWADKFVFWFADETSQHVHSFLRASYIYDVPIFLSYLFVIPALAMFTIRIETGFYVHYKKYFLSILNKHPYSSLEERYRNITGELKMSMGRLIVFQGTITVVAIFLSAKIYNYIGMEAVNLGVFQIALLANFLQVLLQILLIVTLYFDFRKDALILSALFASMNTVLSIISIKLGFSYYGYGYFGSCLIALTAGFLLFNYRLKDLIYYTFVNQKIVVAD